MDMLLSLGGLIVIAVAAVVLAILIWPDGPGVHHHPRTPKPPEIIEFSKPNITPIPEARKPDQCVPGPGPSNIVVRTPTPFKAPKSVADQDRIRWPWRNRDGR